MEVLHEQIVMLQADRAAAQEADEAPRRDESAPLQPVFSGAAGVWRHGPTSRQRAKAASRPFRAWRRPPQRDLDFYDRVEFHFQLPRQFSHLPQRCRRLPWLRFGGLRLSEPLDRERRK
jgi:hypothetical protein